MKFSLLLLIYNQSCDEGTILARRREQQKRKDLKRAHQKQLLDAHAPFMPPDEDEMMTFSPEDEELETLATGEIEEVEGRDPLRMRTVITSVYREKSAAPPPQKKTRTGKMVLGLGTIVFALIGLGFFLPPISLFERLTEAGWVENPYHFQEINTANAEISLADFTLTATNLDDDSAFWVRLNAISAQDYERGNLPQKNWNCPDSETLPYYLIPFAKIYSIEHKGKPSEGFAIQIQLSNSQIASTSPYYLDLYVFDPAIARWSFVPVDWDSTMLKGHVKRLPICVLVAETRAIPSVRGIGLYPTDTQLTNGSNYMFSRLYANGLTPSLNGHLIGSLPAGSTSQGRYALIPIISNTPARYETDIRTIETLLDNPTLRGEHITQLINFAASESYVGLAIDYRELTDTPVMRQNFNSFIADLARGLHAQEQLLSVVVPIPTSLDNGKTWQTGVYDWQFLGYMADEIILQLPLDPNLYAENGILEDVLQWAVTQVNRYNLSLGLSALSVEEADGVFAPIGFQTAQENADQTERKIWLTTPEVLESRIFFAEKYHLGSVLIFDGFTEDVAPQIIEVLHPLYSK